MECMSLGIYGPYPAAGGTTSSHLLRADGRLLLLDVGSGALSRLQEVCSLTEPCAVVISHLHYDHMCDLFVWDYALGSLQAAGRWDGRMPLYAPDSPQGPYRALSEFKHFDLHTIEPGMLLDNPPFKVSFATVQHPAPGFAVRIESGGASLVYTGDLMDHSVLIPFASGADAILANAGRSDAAWQPGCPHISASMAGALAAACGADKLWLSHLSPDEDPERWLGDARRVFANARPAPLMRWESVR